jgi:hypothetical protein
MTEDKLSIQTRDIKTGLRMLIFFVCSATSSFGGYMGGVLLYTGGFECLNAVSPHDPNCAFHGVMYFAILFASFFAWTMYFIMAASWIGEGKIPQWLPVAGTVAALSFFVPEIIIGTPEHTIRSEFLLVAMQLMLVSPAVLLAIFLVVHHLTHYERRLPHK